MGVRGARFSAARGPCRGPVAWLWRHVAARREPRGAREMRIITLFKKDSIIDLGTYTLTTHTQPFALSFYLYMPSEHGFLAT